MDHRADRSGSLPFTSGLTSITVLDVQKDSHRFVDAFGVRCTGKTDRVSMSTIANGKILYNRIESDYGETAPAASAEYIYEGGQRIMELKPAAACKIGAGRSQGAKDVFVDRISKIPHPEPGAQKRGRCGPSPRTTRRGATSCWEAGQGISP